MKILAALRQAFAKLKEKNSGLSTNQTDNLFIRGDVLYSCNLCMHGIDSGEDRFHCEECDESFDLCQGCYSSIGEEHTATQGSDHTFTVEHRSPRQLFDAIHADTLEATLLNMFRLCAQRKCFGTYNSKRGEYEWIRFSDVYSVVCSLAAALHSLKTPPSAKMVAICGISSAKWYSTQIAASLMCRPTVPIVTNADEATMEYVLNQTEAAVAFCTGKMLDKFIAVAPKCPNLSTLVVMEEESDFSTAAEVKAGGLKVFLFAEFIRLGQEATMVDFNEFFKPAKDDIYMVMYTSGSTGKPKGCIFTRELYNNTLKKVYPTLLRSGGIDVWFSFQPAAHSTDHRMVLGILATGGRVGFYRGNMQNVFEDVRLVRPTVVACTPRFWTLIFNQYQQEVLLAKTQAVEHWRRKCKEIEARQKGESEEEKSPQGNGQTVPATISKKLSERGALALEQATLPQPSLPPSEKSEEENLEKGLRERVSLKQAEQEELRRGLQRQVSVQSEVEQSLIDDRPVEPDVKDIEEAVMRRFSTILGNRVVILVTGGAATSPAVLRFMRSCFNAMVSDGYGATEVGAITHDGRISSEAQVKLVDVPELGYLTSDDPPRGEICVKTPLMITGYYRNEAETAAKFVDGYFRTGDIGLQEESGKVRIIDRKKNLFKLAQGEFVSPERLENLLVGSSAFISQVFVYGESSEDSVVAVIVPHRSSLLQWYKDLPSDRRQNGLTDDTVITDAVMAAICKDVVVEQLFMKETERVAKQNSLPSWEVPCAIFVDHEPFSEANGLLTAASKPCRPKLQVHYRNRFQHLYELEAEKRARLLETQVRSLVEVVHKSKGTLSGSSLAERGVDSLSAVQLSELLHQQLDINLPAALLVSMPVEKIVHHVQQVKAIGRGHRTAALQTSPMENSRPRSVVSFTQDVLLSDSIKPSPSQGKWLPLKREKASLVLLTGATGFIGCHILRQLLIRLPLSRILCIVRAGSPGDEGVQTARARLLQQLSPLIPVVREHEAVRVEALVGDLRLPCLGLNNELYARLAETVDLVIHNGAEVSSAKPYHALRAANVQSTIELLRLVCSGKTKRLHYVSSIGVFGGQPADPCYRESDHPTVKRVGLLNGYSQSKWVSEQLVMEANLRGVDTVISRPSLVGPHELTGQCNHGDWLCFLLRGVVQLGLVPIGAGCDERAINLVSVDYVSAAITHLSFSELKNDHSLFHLVPHGSLCTWKEIVHFLLLCGYKLRKTDYKSFRTAVLNASASNNSVMQSLALLLPASGGLPYSHRFDGGQTLSALEKSGIHPCSTKESYFRSYFAYMAEQGLLSPPDENEDLDVGT